MKNCTEVWGKGHFGKKKKIKKIKKEETWSLS